MISGLNFRVKNTLTPCGLNILHMILLWFEYEHITPQWFERGSGHECFRQPRDKNLPMTAIPFQTTGGYVLIFKSQEIHVQNTQTTKGLSIIYPIILFICEVIDN